MRILALAIALFWSSVTVSDASLEQERLSQIAKELELLVVLVESSRNQMKGSEKQKIRFEYNTLISRLKSLEHGVLQHINLQNQSPREHWDLGIVAEGEKDFK